MINLKINGNLLQKIELIIFDKDGTLFELFPYWKIVAQRRAENICHTLNIENNLVVEWLVSLMGVDEKNKVMNPKGPIGIMDRLYIQNFLLRELILKGFAVELNTIIEAFNETDNYIKNDEILKKSLVMVQGLELFLTHITKDCYCAIFSFDQTKNIQHIVELMKIDYFFSYILGGDQIKYPKPDPWGVVKIMTDLNISPEHTILIGDSIHDIESGKNAGCKYTITRRSDISDIKRIKEISDIIIDDFYSIKI